MEKRKLFLLDAMALIYRAHYAMNKNPRITSKGINTSAILGFTNTLFEILKKEKPSHIAVAFDSAGPTIRHIDFSSYKANREETPVEIVTAVPYIKKIIEAFKIPVLSLNGYEADDIIGTIAKQAEKEDFEVFMMTSDKDYGQLVSENIKMYKPAKFGNGIEILGTPEICQKYNLKEPSQLIDILGLWGDSADNIPGVPGIGEVKAKKLISEFEHIENIYDRIDEVKEVRTKESLIAYKDQAFLSKKLATIILDVPLNFNEKDFHLDPPDETAIKNIFNELEFKTLTTRLQIYYQWNKNTVSPPIVNSLQPDLFSILDEKPAIITPTVFHYNSQSIYVKKEADLYPLKTELENFRQCFFEFIYDDENLINAQCLGIHLCSSESKSYCIIFRDDKPEIAHFIRLIFEEERIEKISYNLKKVHLILKRLGWNFKGKEFDIQLAHYVIQPELSHDLMALAEHYLNYRLTDFESFTNKRNVEKNWISNISEEQLSGFFGEKTWLYFRLYSILNQELSEKNAAKVFYDIEMPLSEILADMEYEGVHFNIDILKEYKTDLEKDLTNLESQIFEMAGSHFNLASPKQLGDILFTHLKIIENAKLTKSKQFQTGEEVLSKLENKHPIIPLILQHRQLSKLKSTYVDALPLLINPRTGRIHAHFNQTVTATGRLSSSNPNLQNIPIRTQRGREIRKAFTGRDETAWIISADYSQIELRIMATMSHDESMLNAFQHGMDIHAATAATVFKTDIDKVTPEMRRIAKTVNFGIIYGISAFGLADRLKIKTGEARNLIQDYFNHFPKIKIFMDSCIHEAQTKGYVETLFGRRRYIKDINSKNGLSRSGAERTAINAPIQGTAADLIKIAMINIYKKLNLKGLKTKMILQVHDELVFDVPDQEVDEILDIVGFEMAHVLNAEIPLDMDIHAGKNWHEAH